MNLAAGLVLAHGAWWTVVCLVAAPPPKRRPLRVPSELRLAVLIPAHNEEDAIGPCLASIRGAAADAGLDPVIVLVADNCTDGTATIAGQYGVVVLERVDIARRGKPYAISHGIEWLAANDPPDAVLFLDADSQVDTAFLAAMAGRAADGALAVQSYYAAAGSASDVQRLRRLALMLVHWARPLGSSRLGLGVGFKGNGMLIAWPVARSGLGAEGIAEDAAMTLDLARRGVVIEFEPRAVVRGQMPRDYGGTRTQDRRWEGGRILLIPRALTTAARACLAGRWRVAAAALEVGTLPLSLLVFMSAGTVLMAVSGVGSFPLAVGAAASLTAYVIAGLAAARPSPRELLALVTVPRYLLYKASVFAGLLIHGAPRSWERTSRDKQTDASAN